MTLAEIAAVVDGTAYGEATVTGAASVDSREVEPGGLFVAVAGERVDGHDYAEAAVAAGAAAVLGMRETGVPTVVVADPVAALGVLARHVLDRLPEVFVLALTGSQGKTGTKDYLAQVLATAGETVATRSNYNNELGVPLTVLRAGPGTRYLLVEMGARGTGHVGYLCRIAPPRVAAVLNVGTAHLSEFGTREAIAAAKGEILEALPADGVAVLNADDPRTRGMHVRTDARVLRFGRGPDEAAGPDTGPPADVAWYDVSLDDLGRPSARLAHTGEELPLRLRGVGEHQLANAAAAAAMAVAAGLRFPDVVAALGEAVGLSRWRMETTELDDGTVVVNDAYNANPASMRAALAALVDIGGRRGGRTLAVLGEMKELGPGSDEEHRALGERVAALGVDVLLAVGAPAALLVEGAAQVTSWSGAAVPVTDREAALAWLRGNVAAGDVVLVKASRGAALEVVAEALVQRKEPR